jgi:hypothetical protein
VLAVDEKERMAQFRVMSWNIENLFDVGDDDGPETAAQLNSKIESLRAVIDAQKPHVLALQEIGSETALGRLQAALSLPMQYRAVAAPDEVSGWRSSVDECCMTRPRSESSRTGCFRFRWVTTRPDHPDLAR